MKKSMLFLLFLTLYATLNAQTYFNKLIKLKFPDFGAIGEVLSAKDGGYYFPYDIVNYKIDSSFIHIVKVDAKGDSVWAKRYGEPKKKHFYSTWNMTLTPEEDIIITGNKRVPDSLYKNKYSGFAIKIDKNGNQKWFKEYTDGSYYFRLRQTIICSDGNYLMIGYNIKTKSTNYADPYIVKTDTSGNVLWQTILEQPNYHEIVEDVIEISNQEYLIVGYRYNGNTGFDNLALKLNSKGQKVVYTWSGEEEHNDFFASIIPTNDGNFIVAGINSEKNPTSISQRRSIIAKINDKGDRLWTKSYEEATDHFTYNKLLKLPNGDFIGVGKQDLKPYRCGATKFDKEGNIKWHKSYLYSEKNGLSQDMWGGDITQDGGIILCGTAFRDTLAEGSEGWLLKLDSLGCNVEGCDINATEEEATATGVSFFNAYPNPSSEHITLALNEASTTATSVKIINIYGTTVYKNKIPINEQNLSIDVSGFASGAYMLVVENERSKGVKKIVVLK